MAIYKLVDSHNVAKRAAEDHAETLKKLQDELKATAQEATKFSAEQTKDMALAEWGLKLKTAEQNIKDLQKELKNTGGLSFTTRFTPNALLEDYEIYAKDWANILRQSKIDLERYEEEIWKLAAEYPDFQPQAQEIQNKLLLLKAAEEDARKARDELSYLENPELRPKVEVDAETEDTTVTPIDDNLDKVVSTLIVSKGKSFDEEEQNKLKNYFFKTQNDVEMTSELEASFPMWVFDNIEKVTDYINYDYKLVIDENLDNVVEDEGINLRIWSYGFGIG